ncbi:MAG TPA: uroporphyrinogen decarboxylase family protein [Tepidisphaeraceae bacterium]
MKEMTPRERWMAMFNRQETDRVPTDYWWTPELHARLLRDLNCTDFESLWRKLHIDRAAGVGAAWKPKTHPLNPKGDMWGIEYETIDYGTGAYTETAVHPLANVQTVEEVHRYPWPSADDFEFGGITDFVATYDRYRPVSCGGYEPFLLYAAMRGLEQAYEDLLVNQEIAAASLGHIFDFNYELNRRSWEAGKGKIDYMYLAEDLGSQTGPLMSVELYRKFLLPNQKKMADLAHSYDIKVFYHTDGAAQDFLPDLIDVVKIDLLNPIQWRCPGMERETLVKNWGDRVIFHGAMDNQQTLPFGTVEDVKREVRENLEIFKDSRWICAPCHNIQPLTPTANVLALYETIRELGKHGG